MVSIILGLLRQKKFDFVDAYKAEAFTTIRAVVKQVSIISSGLVRKPFTDCTISPKGKVQFWSCKKAVKIKTLVGPVLKQTF